MTPPIHIHIRSGQLDRIDGIPPGLQVYVTDHDAAENATVHHTIPDDEVPAAMMDFYEGATSALVYDGISDDPLVHVKFDVNGVLTLIRVRPDAESLVKFEI